MQALGTKPLLGRIEQHGLRIATMQRKLRPLLAGMPAHRLAVNELAEAIEKYGFLGDHGPLRERLQEVERGEFGHRLGKQVQPGADRL
jgi:hypothetical protein